MKPSRIAKRLIAPALLAATLVVVQVVLAAPPQPSFSVVGPNFTTTCGLYTFTSTSTDPDNDIASIAWNLAGTPASGSSVTATFATPGTRTISMTATDAAGGDDTTEDSATTEQPVTVVNEGAPNGVVSAAPTTAQPNQTITFSAAASTDSGSGSIAKYEWDKDGDGTYETDTLTTASTTNAFADSGFHTVGLRVTDNCGAQDFASASVFVNNTLPTASFTVTPNPAGIGATVTFNGAASSDTGGSIASYAWDFEGDDVFDATTTTATTTHVYPTSGQYTPQLRVTDNDGGTQTTFRSLKVNAKPTASFSYLPVTPLINSPVTFNGASSSDPDGSVASYAWDLDGDGTYEATGATPAHTYATAGTVTVRLRVTDNNLTVSDVLEREVTVQASQPKAGFTYAPHDPLPGQAVTLTSTSAPSASPGAPSLVATQWDFVYSPLVDFTLDGAGASIVTSFATAGAHPVAVKVTETGGGYAIASDTIVVNAPPVASFTVAPAKAVEGKQVTFASTSGDPDGPLVQQEWDLNGDGKFEKTGAVASTTKLKKGPRRIALRVTDSKGAQATSTQVITVKAPDLRNPQDVGSTLSYTRRSWGVVVVGFTIKTPAQTSVAVTCKGGGCPRGTFRKRTHKKAATLAFSKLTGSLRAGAKINIIFARTGRITGWDVYTIGHGKTALREGCKPSGAKKQKRCP
jgi:large repetitive protein